MVGVDFSPYLTFVCTAPRYQETLSRYTVTDAIHLVLEAQTVVREEAGGREREEQRQQVEPFPVLERLGKYAATDHVLLSGKPGSGKSTTLKRLLLEMAKANLSPQPPLLAGEGEQDFSPSHRQGEIGGEGKIPVLVQLKSNRPILEAIRAEFRQGKLSVSTEQIDHWLLDGKLFLLLDGVNEIPSEELRGELQVFREDNPHTPMIFTTRDLAVGGDLGIEKKLEMRPLTDTQMREFVGKHLPEYGEVLLRQLQDRLREVAETPLLLKMLCEVFDPQTRQIPQSKGELFRAFDQKYHQHKQNPPVSGDFRRFQSEVLQHLAFEMVRGDDEKPTEAWLTVPRRKAEGILEAWLGKRGVADAPTKAKEWLEDLLEHHLLQVAPDPSQIEFHHQLFQEYYAAEALLARVENRHPDVMDDERLQHFFLNYLKWTEPVALMVALLGDETQVVRVVRLALDVDLKLGARLAGEAKPEFQGQTVGIVSVLEIPEWFKVELFKYAIPLDKSESDTTIKSQPSCRENVDNHRIKADFRSSPKYGELSRLVGDPCWSVIDALGKIGSKNAIPELHRFLAKSSGYLKEKAIFALGEIGDESVTPDLLHILQTSSLDSKGTAIKILGKMQAEPAIPYFLSILENEPYVRSRNDIAGILGGFQRERAAHILPDLVALIPTESGQHALRAISGIQQNCQFYNYEIFHKQLPPVVSPQPSGVTVTYTIDSEIVQIIENNHDTAIGTQNLKTTED
jgi:DNA polymerase III delta prime subunit